MSELSCRFTLGLVYSRTNFLPLFTCDRPLQSTPSWFLRLLLNKRKPPGLQRQHTGDMESNSSAKRRQTDRQTGIGPTLCCLSIVFPGRRLIRRESGDATRSAPQPRERWLHTDSLPDSRTVLSAAALFMPRRRGRIEESSQDVAFFHNTN